MECDWTSMGSLMQELTAMNVGYPIICGTMIHPSPDIMDTGVYIAVGTAVFSGGGDMVH